MIIKMIKIAIIMILVTNITKIEKITISLIASLLVIEMQGTLDIAPAIAIANRNEPAFISDGYLGEGM